MFLSSDIPLELVQEFNSIAMSESEDEAAFRSADEDVEEKKVDAKDKKPSLESSSLMKDNKVLSSMEFDQNAKTSNKNTRKKKKKNKQAKSNEEEISVEKLSFESSDSIISTESASLQVDNMHSSKPDLEEIRITDESDESNRTSRNNLFHDGGGSPKELLEEETEKGTEAADLEDEEVKESRDTTCADSQMCDQKSETQSQQSSWGWAKWGSSIIGAAASSVTTFTTQLGDGVNTIIDTVESGLSVVPTPEELAREAKEAENINSNVEQDADHSPADTTDDINKSEETYTDSANATGWWSGWGGVSKITGAVQEKSKNLVSGSLDVLESLGRKTFDAINEHDRTVLREKTKMLFERGESPQLTDLLKEAKEQTEIQEKIAKENEEALKSDFATLFEDYQGQAHMDALQLLSQQSEAKLGFMLESLSPNSESEAQVRSQLLSLKDAFEITIEDEDDLDKDHLFARLVTDHLSEVHLGTQPDKLNMCQASARKWIAQFIESHSSLDKDTDESDAKDVYTTAIQSMAELTSKIIEQFHKSGELILLQKDLDKSMEDRAKSLASLTKIFWTEINILSTKFAKCLNLIEEKEDEKTINKYITNVYLEASNSSSYIDDGFRSLLPIMQLALLEKNFKE